MRLSLWSGCLVVLGIAAPVLGASEEKISDGVVRIGLILDLSGRFAYLSGEGSVIAARMAVEDFGGQALGYRIEVVTADHTNMAHIASAKASEWFDTGKVDALMEVSATSPALAVAKVARQKNRIAVFNAAASARLTNEACTPVTVHWTFDTYAVAHVTGAELVRSGGDSWYFVTADYSYGHALEKDAAEVVRAAGGKVLGSSMHAIGGADFTSHMLRAQQSGAKVIGLATGGADFVSAIKAAGALGVTAKGQQRLAALLGTIGDVHSLGSTTRMGEGYDKLSEMYEAVVQQRHRELVYVTKVVGGVEETRHQAGRGNPPFVPVAPDRQRQAVKFLVQRAFIEPKALLDPDVLNRIVPSGGANPLHGSNVDLMQRMIDPVVFQRMLEASSLGKGRYTGLELLSDLNDGLFRELAARSPAVSPYRRQVQRSYVTVLLSATGTVGDPAATNANIERAFIDSAYLESGVKGKVQPTLRAARSFDSAIAEVGKQYSNDAGPLSEYRAVLRAAVAELYQKIENAIARTQDKDTLLHLRLIRSQLANVS